MRSGELMGFIVSGVGCFDKCEKAHNLAWAVALC